jgi:hypothetical protein
MKEFIKDYILSQVTQTTPTNEIQILNQSEQSSENFGYSYVKTENNVVFYANSENGMMFYVYDRYFNLVKQEELTTNALRIVGETLKVDENGNFYMVGYVTPTNSNTEVYALILLNNLVSDTAQLRKYYKLSDYGISQNVLGLNCQKRQGSADYLFVYEKERIVGSTHYFDLTFTQLTISVQNGNSTTTWSYQGYQVNESIYIDFLGIGFQYNQEASKILVVNYGNTDFNRRVTLIDLGEWNATGTTYLTIGNGVAIDKMLDTETYSNMTGKDVIVNGIQSITFINSPNLQLAQYNIIDNFTSLITKPFIEEGDPYKFILTQDYIGYLSSEEEGNNLLNIKKYELTENDINISSNILKIPFYFEYDWYYISKINLINIDTYNLTSICMVLIEEAGTGTTTIVQTDNSVQEYQDYNSLVPSYVNISNGHILFSRKLTNESIIGNQMSAEVNIPYSMLNRSFSVEQLISQTYKVLSNENKTINKNIYESLYLNFIKHINVIDNNFGKSELQNDISALLTKSIFSLPEENYGIAPIGYAKIFTTDGQELIFSIGSNAITQIGDYEYQISIAVNGNNADKLQILAKDQKTPYVTIPLHTVDKVILLKQNFKIEEG